MLDADFVRKNPGEVVKMLFLRGMDMGLVIDFLNADAVRRRLVQERDALAAEKNRVSELLRIGIDDLWGEDALVEYARGLKTALADMNRDAEKAEADAKNALLALPNMIQFGEVGT